MGKITVLVVDDNRNVLEFLRSAFESFGARVFMAENAYNAIDIIKRIQANLDSLEYFDLIVSDLEMPGKTGLELLSEVRCHSHKAVSQIPFVLISGIMNFEISQKAKELGVTETAVKPITLEEIEKFLSLAS